MMLIEKIVLDHLRENLMVPVYMEVPEIPSESHAVMPTEFVVIDKFAGSVTNKVWSASIAIQSYSLTSMYGAALLNDAVHEVMDEMADHVPEISGCKMTADTNFTDVRTKRYRYQCTYNIFY